MGAISLVATRQHPQVTMVSQSSVSSAAGDWQSKVAEKRASCHKAIPEAWALPRSLLATLPKPSDLMHTKVDLISMDIPRRSGILTERELEITESYNVASLLKSLASGEFTSSEVTLAFSKRAAIAQQLVRPMPKKKNPPVASHYRRLGRLS